jgi:putative tryptophan/tyrosine transport system substrate-binding protein
MAKKKKAAKRKKRAAATLTVGVMHSGTTGGPGRPDDNIKQFRDALNATYTGAQHIQHPAALFAQHNRGQLPIHAGTLVRANVDLLVAAGGTASAEAAKNATQTIPIVFTSVSDPAQAVPNPGNNRNMTGVCARTSGLDADRLQILHELYPKATKFGVLF